MRHTSFPNLDAVLKELKIINRGFESHFTEMPSTFCVVNQHKHIFVGYAKTDKTHRHLIAPQLPDASDTLFHDGIRRQGRDEHFSITQSNHVWRTSLHKKPTIFITIMTHILSWARMSHLAMASAKVSPRGEQVTDGVNLLSVG